MAEIAVLGTGYVGLAAGAALASLGHQVRCLDINAEKIGQLSLGVIPIVEEGLEELVSAGLNSGCLSFSTDLEVGVSEAEFVFLCLPTPQGDDGAADLSYIRGVLPLLRKALRNGAILVNKSTVPVGTAVIVASELGRPDVSVVSNPEFLRQGTAVKDFLVPSRVIVGGNDAEAVDAVARLYDEINAPILRMGPESAEALKYAANAFLATKLTFINAMADICEAVGADIFEVAGGIGLDPRIGPDMLRAGPGWGGSCFPKDTRALVSIASEGGYDFSLLRGVIETNDSHYERIARKVIQISGGSIAGCTVAAWGVTFKAGTDDLRDSPAIKILEMLHQAGAIVRAYDPTAHGAYAKYPWLEIGSTAMDVCQGADVLALLTEWPEFAQISPMHVAEQMTTARVVDARNHLDRELWRNAGFEYIGVGR